VVKMTYKEIFKTGSLKDLIYFPLLFNVIGFVCIGFLYAVSSRLAVDFNTLQYLVFIIEWVVAFIVIGRLRRQGLPLKGFIMPRKEFKWIPAFLVFVSLNMLLIVYLLYPLIPIPSMGHLSLLQLLFFLALLPVTAGFVEELIWRGYFIEKLLAKGYSEWKTILFSSISFAFIHGLLVDKLIVTFLFGLIAGIYYLRERNLVVLMGTHTVVDIVGFALKIFA